MKETNSYPGKILRCALLLSLMTSIVSCTNVDKTNSSITPETQQKELQEVTSIIREQNSRFERFFLNGNSDSLKLIFAENVKQYLPHQPPTIGLGELIKNNQLIMSWGKWQFRLSTEEVKKSGQIAIERGKYKLSFTPNDDSPIPASLDSGNYLVLWERFDGKWKIVWDAPVTEIPLK